jgi:predicted RNase H-like HicB family nuclease
MAAITAIIEKGNDGGFNIYSPDVKGVYASAPTEAEAKSEFLEMLEEQAEDIMERSGTCPTWYSAYGM